MLPELQDYVGCTQAAHILNVSPVRVRQMVEDGTITHTLETAIGRLYYIPELNRLRRERAERPPGRGAKAGV